MNEAMIRDLRKNLNEAQDYGQETLVWIKRAVKLNRADFEFDVYDNARTAFSRAVRFCEFADQTVCNMAEDLK